MTPTTYQPPEIRDGNDNIVQQGAFGKNSPLSNSTNDGWIDYVANDLNFLYDLAKDEIVPVPSLPASGQMNKTYLLTTTGVSYRWSGTEWVSVSSSEAVGRAEAAANLAEQWATKTSGTVDGTEYSAKYYAEQAGQSADDAQDTADDMATHLVQIDKNTGGVSKNSKRISNIEKLLQGNLYDYDTDDDVAYTKTVPAGAMPYAGLEKLGGKTVAWNQLVQNGNFEDTTGWAHPYADIVANNNILSATVTSVTTAGATRIELHERYCPMITGHKYYATCMIYSPALISCMFQNRNVASGTDPISVPANTWTRFDVLYTCTNNSGSMLYYNINSGLAVGDTVQFKEYMVFDLTLMFGSGNEPTSVAEFQQMFPSAYYPYNAGTLLSAGVTEVKSVGKNLADISIVKAFYPSLVTIVSADEFTFVSSHSMSATNRFFDNVEKRSGRMSISYSVKYNSATSRGVYLRVYYTDGSFDRLYNTAATNTWQTVSWTSSATKTVDYVAWSYKNADVLATLKDLQIEWNSTATSYSPYKKITYPIPAEIRNLEGYGWSAGSVYNYIDYERKVFVKNVGSVNLGDLTWATSETSTPGVYKHISSRLTNSKNPAGASNFANAICKNYVTLPYEQGYSQNKEKTLTIVFASSSQAGKVYIIDSNYTTDSAFNSAISGVYLFYELETPVETDISAYLTDDNLVQVESGGTLTFPNNNGDNYRIPVPSEETYMINLQEAVSNG